MCVCVGGGGGVGGGGAMRSRESSTQKATRVQGSLHSPYKMERLLRWLCSTQASGHLFCFSPCTYFSALLYRAHAQKALKGNLLQEEKPSPFSLFCIPLCVGKPQKNNLRSICRVMDLLSHQLYQFS